MSRFAHFAKAYPEIQMETFESSENPNMDSYSKKSKKYKNRYSRSKHKIMEARKKRLIGVPDTGTGVVLDCPTMLARLGIGGKKIVAQAHGLVGKREIPIKTKRGKYVRKVPTDTNLSYVYEEKMRRK